MNPGEGSPPATSLDEEIAADGATAEREARDRATAIVAEAEREAEEIRIAAKAIVDEARKQVNELMLLRQGMIAMLRATLNDFEGVIARAEDERVFAEAESAQQ